MNGRACSLVRASAIRMCKVQYPYGAWAWAACSLPSEVNCAWAAVAMYIMNGRACSFACKCGTHVYSTRTGPGHERTCVFVCACECGTHVYGTRTGPGHGGVLPTGRGARPKFILGLVGYIFACVRAVRCLAWAVRAVYLVCVCVCVRRSACAARALYHSPSVRVCVRCTVYGMVAWAACVVYMSVTCTYVLCVYHLNTVWRG